MPAPDATTDNYSITEDQLLVGSANGFLNNDADLDGDRLSIIRVDSGRVRFSPKATISGRHMSRSANSDIAPFIRSTRRRTREAPGRWLIGGFPGALRNIT